MRCSRPFLAVAASPRPVKLSRLSLAVATLVLSDGMESKLTSCCYIVLQALVLVTTSPESDFACRLQCPLQNQTGDILYEVGCGPDCKISQCLKGCSLWEKALEASCQAVCNGTQELVPPRELYCVMGCNDALNRYLQNLKEELGRPPAPALVADSLTPTSLKLEWDRNRYPELTTVIQWSLAGDDDGDQSDDGDQHAQLTNNWQYAANQSWSVPGQILVGGLRPYTNYRFRVILLAQGSELTSSEPSLVIGTLAGGLPTGPPSLLRAAATDPTRVSVSWSRGAAPNGPVLSYVVSIDELPVGYKAHKDIPATEKKEFYIFQGLLPSRNYTVSVAMRNAVGVGPPATTVVTTPPLSQVKGPEKTILILGAHHSVFSQAADMLDDPVVIYRTNERIRGVAVHLRMGLLFVSDSTGRILVTSSREHRRPRVVLEKQGPDFVPHSLSVDWLNNQLYILAQLSNNRWQVTRCELDGSGMTVAVAGLLDKPLHVEVDPYNGYLFWVIEGHARGGLYRLDTAHISNGIRHEVKPELILQNPNLGAFTVDHTNFRILVSSHAKNTVLAVSLDGKEVADLRHNTQSPQFMRVLSLTMANGLLYWTNGELVLTEEYHNGKDSYFHNVIIPDSSDPGYVSIGVDLPSAQPVPSPINPPTGIQAIMGAGHIRASWNSPHLLGGQGKGAWQNWTYQLSVEDVETKKVTLLEGINDTRALVKGGLRSAQEYKLRVAATTSAGVGPWSGTFIGRTLSEQGTAARLVWASSTSGLIVSDLAAETLSTYLYREHFQDDQGGVEHITDIAWHKNILYLVTNTSKVLWYDINSREHGRIPLVTSVGSIAVDWVGNKLYWSSPKQQLLTRGNLDGSDQEPLPILTVAKELNIDSEGAYIYWSTGHAVECARLNGKQRRIYYPAELFSGKQVMGLTLDLTARQVFWVVRNYEGSTLFKANMANGLNSDIAMEKVSLIQNHDILGPLVYLDRRLVWVRDDRQAVIGDLSGSNSALLASPSLTDLSVLAVIDHSLHVMSKFEDDLVPQAIPAAVEVSTLKVVGNHRDFNLTWGPVTNVNVGQVFYELKVTTSHQKEILIETTEPSWTFPEGNVPPPYSRLDVTLRAYTFWGGSSAITSCLYSPQTSPSHPSHPRVFVNVLPSRVTEVVFRWDPPASPNGLIIGYKVVCWLDGSDSFLCNARDLGPDDLSLVTHEVPFNATAFFQVRACTASGCGPMTSAVIARTDKPNPVPQLLMFTNSSLSLIDVDRGTNVTLAQLSAPVSDAAYVPEAVYWLDDSAQVIVRAHSHTSTKHRIFALNGTGSGLAVDWVANMLYWSESSPNTGESEIRSLDLTYFEKTHKIRVETVITRPHPISTIQISPSQSIIYWYEEYSNRSSALWKGSINGKNVQPFFGIPSRKRYNRRWGRGICTCPDDPHPAPSFAIDHLSSALVWTDLTTKRLVASDFEGCGCTILIENASFNSTGLPPTSITTDQNSIYWTNNSENTLYSIAKSELENYAPVHISKEEIRGVSMILSYGSHLLPYPNLKCLIPSRPAYPPILIEKNSHSIVLRLTPSEVLQSCGNSSRPSPVFTVYYNLADSMCSSNHSECSSLVTMDTVFEVPNLNSYSDYVFMVSETNSFTEKANIRPELSIPVVFQTAPGAPSPPENVAVQVLSPTALLISWEPPHQINSGSVFYEVHWTSEDLVEGSKHKGEQKVEPSSSSYESTLAVPDSNVVSTRIFRLLPSVLYLIWVRAYSENGEAYSEGPHFEVRMFPEPNNLTLVNATAYSLEMSWQRDPDLPYVRHDLEFVDGSTGDWDYLQPVNASEDGVYIYVMDNLKPRTVFTYRMKIIYLDQSVPFFWPVDTRFVFKTLGDRPSRPGSPVIHHLSKDVAQLAWDPSKDNGSPIHYYQLDGMNEDELSQEQVRRSVSNSTQEEPWSLFYQGTDNFWVLSSLDVRKHYRFRVRAFNDYGWSDYSESSGSFDLTRAALLHQEITIILWLLTPAAIILTIFIFMCGLYRHEKTKKWGNGSIAHVSSSRNKGPDVELASLRQIPRWSTHIQSSNVLYAAGNLASVDSLPHLRRDQITLTKFLGSGAFGEVFEGLARSLPDSSKDVTRVAVKTLRKGANDNEKEEFLKEAQLMSNFRHPHILQLLGVCLDNDPHFIIMELMEGGDLLSYLRASRPLLKLEDGLKLLDLVSMCVDVARGCCYLEEMHFVHRDLACRNCLVSSRLRTERLVKIGDFGLARDIYKNDYYRKEGEGLLPVRWMAPESLVDGVFTSQSDVWSFGVLLWEIMSLGQQPYPARNNLEVLNYVRIGGRLGRPTNSDAELYDLMTKCWSFFPAERPTFKYCLEILEGILSHTANVPLTTCGLPNGVTRQSSNSKSAEMAVPKYLELLYEAEAAAEVRAATSNGEGYEVPRSLEANGGHLGISSKSNQLLSCQGSNLLPPDFEEAFRLLPPSPTSPGPS